MLAPAKTSVSRSKQVPTLQWNYKSYSATCCWNIDFLFAQASNFEVTKISTIYIKTCIYIEKQKLGLQMPTDSGFTTWGTRLCLGGCVSKYCIVSVRMFSERHFCIWCYHFSWVSSVFMYLGLLVSQFGLPLFSLDWWWCPALRDEAKQRVHEWKI